MSLINSTIQTQTNLNTEDPTTALLWEQKFSSQNMKFFLKKGGSSLNSSKPYFRTEFTFDKEYKMDKLIKTIY